MSYRTAMALILCGTLAASAGCSTDRAVSNTGTVAASPSPAETHLRVWIDGQKAVEDPTKGTAAGYSEWKLDRPVSVSPRVKYEIAKADKLGRVTMVTVGIFQQLEGDYARQAEYTVYSSGSEPASQMKPGTEYNLGKPGGGLSIADSKGNIVDGVKLAPGKKYRLVLTVKGNKSETAGVDFKTR